MVIFIFLNLSVSPVRMYRYMEVSKLELENNNNRVISSLCYFSIFFAGFILPVIVYFAVKEQEVKRHAKRALLSHLLLLVPTIIGVIIFMAVVAGAGFYSYSFETGSPDASSNDGMWIMGAWLIFIVVEAILSLGVFIWNIVQGIKVLKV